MPTNSNGNLPTPPPLPENRTALLAQRSIAFRRTLNDMVEDVHLALWDDEENGEAYRSYLYAVYDEQAVEGSLAADNLEAAAMIRQYAVDHTIAVLVREKKATVAKALGVVLRRYDLSRKERRDMVHGEVVPGNSGD